MAEEKGKIVLDPIYGMIELDSLAVKIIDTPYFQRLRYIKQLSTADFVYPGATHTRFAHSIGVYHLACEMIKRIESQGLDKDVLLSKKEKRCIQVAALCHDMGHGPFSHAYEIIFKEELQGLKHEDISAFLVEKMMFKDTREDLTKELKYGDIGHIKALIQHVEIASFLVEKISEREDLKTELKDGAIVLIKECIQNVEITSFLVEKLSERMDLKTELKDGVIGLIKECIQNAEFAAFLVQKISQREDLKTELKDGVIGLIKECIQDDDISEYLFNKLWEVKWCCKLKDVDIDLIKALIQGNYEKYEKDPNMKAKKYMFQIVSNETSGMDVDKWDYFNRDAIACGIPERFQFDRALHVVRVLKTGEVYELVYRDHDAFSFYNMYNTRLTLYRKVYRHRVVVAVELMVKDVFHLVREAKNTSAKSEEGAKEESQPVSEANKTSDESEPGAKEESQPVSEANKTSDESEPGLTIDIFPARKLTNGEDPKKNMSLGSIDDSSKDKLYLMIADYLKLRDDVLLKIQDSELPQYEKARKLIERLHTRKLYKLFDEFKVEANTAKKKVDEMQEYLQKQIDGDQSLKDVIRVKVEKFDYWKEETDPVEQIYFYRKGKIHKPEKLERKEVSLVLPNVFREYYIRVYQTGVANDERKLKNVLETFKKKYQDEKFLVIKQKQDAPVSGEKETNTQAMSSVTTEDPPQSNQ